MLTNWNVMSLGHTHTHKIEQDTNLIFATECKEVSVGTVCDLWSSWYMYPIESIWCTTFHALLFYLYRFLLMWVCCFWNFLWPVQVHLSSSGWSKWTIMWNIKTLMIKDANPLTTHDWDKHLNISLQLSSRVSGRSVFHLLYPKRSEKALFVYKTMCLGSQTTFI